jgi:predicted DCC family thiol-disulfide oxidoreductase YuxK
VYDGDCGVCARWATWLGERAPSLEVAPSQSLDLRALGLTEEQVATAAYWVDGSRVEGAERAIARALIACGRGYGVLGRALLLPVVRPAAGVVYRWVAQHRNRLPAPRRP